jgi:hypothetical protein
MSPPIHNAATKTSTSLHQRDRFAVADKRCAIANRKDHR